MQLKRHLALSSPHALSQLFPTPQHYLEGVFFYLILTWESIQQSLKSARETVVRPI